MTDDQASRIFDALDGLRQGQDALRQDVGALRHGQDALQTEVKGLGERVGRLEHWQERLRVDLMERLDRLQDNVTTMREELTVAFESAIQVGRAGRQNRDDILSVSEITTSLQRQVRRLNADVQELRDRKP